MPGPLTPWDDFVLRHRHPTNLAFHFVSCALFWAGPVLAIALRNPWWLAATASSGMVGAAGHAVSGDSDVSVRETTSSPRVVYYSTRMICRVVLGTYKHDIARAVERASDAAPRAEPTT